MGLEHAVPKIFRLDELIKAESTGTVKELAEKLDISERHVYNYLKILSDMGRKSIYDEAKKSFIYKDPH